MTLSEFFEQNNRVALAFSGGVDSSYLLYEAQRCSAQVQPYFAHTVFQPDFEFEDARLFAAHLGYQMRVVELDILNAPGVRENTPDRCYYCKTAMLKAIAGAAAEDGYTVLIDGTNASDDSGDRPGMRALQEKGVLSPLRLCGITKADIRENSRAAGLSIWDKPAYACLATRQQAGKELTEEDLRRAERAETWMRALGFKDFRVRIRGRLGLIQLSDADYAQAVKRRRDIVTALSPEFDELAFDLLGRKPK